MPKIDSKFLWAFSIAVVADFVASILYDQWKNNKNV